MRLPEARSDWSLSLSLSLGTGRWHSGGRRRGGDDGQTEDHGKGGGVDPEVIVLYVVRGSV